MGSLWLEKYFFIKIRCELNIIIYIYIIYIKDWIWLNVIFCCMNEFVKGVFKIVYIESLVLVFVRILYK